MIGILFGSFAFFLLLGIPVAFSIGLTSFLVLYTQGVPMIVVAQRMFAGMDSFALVAVPCFILAGDIMARGKISENLVNFAESIFGFIRGGLWNVVIITSCMFAAMSGSAAATAAAIGTPMIPKLRDKNYPADTSAALIAASGTIGVVIPPSVPMVVYAVVSGVSLSKLFINGFLPGIAMGLFLIGVALSIARRRKLPTGQKLSLKRIASSCKNAVWGLLVPIIILGGIFSGLFTPSEAAVIAVDYAFVVELFIYRDLRFKEIGKLLVGTVITMSTIMLLIGISNVFAWIFANWRVANTIATGILSLSGDKYILMLSFCLIILFLGCFLETSAAIILVTPMFIPLLNALDVNLVHFGVLLVIGLAIGMTTPPVAICLYVASSVSNIPFTQLSRKVVPFLISLIVVLILYAYLPLVFPALIL
jgi:C4-dicarboxylate transporter DctM subunit